MKVSRNAWIELFQKIRINEREGRSGVDEYGCCDTAYVSLNDEWVRLLVINSVDFGITTGKVWCPFEGVSSARIPETPYSFFEYEFGCCECVLL